jgi:hypothetical protein
MLKLKRLRWILTALALAASTAHGFEDSVTRDLLEKTKKEISSQTSDGGRIAAFKKFKKQVHQNLVKKIGPALEVAALTEFEVYLSAIKFPKKITAKACHDIRQKIEFQQATPDEEEKTQSVETLPALELLEALCKDRK